MNTNRFNPLFQARSVAQVGASSASRKWGQRMLNNLLNGGYIGAVYLVNPTEEDILGIPAFNSITTIPETPDLAVIVVPQTVVVPIIRECVAKGVKTGVVITAGFAELGDDDKSMQKEMVEAARAGRMILVCPNCYGFMSPWEKHYVQFLSFFIRPRPIAVVAQSGNIMDVVTRQIILHGSGCSITIAIGNEADLNSEDHLEYLANDPHTEVILSYIEGLKDGLSFFETARHVTRRKPIVIIIAGKTRAGAGAAATHTSAIAGSDVLFEAACKQSGIIRARNIYEMLNIYYTLLDQPLPRGRCVGIMTAGSGYGVLATDAAEEIDLDIISLPASTIGELHKLFPAWWNRGNHVDLVATSATEKSSIPWRRY